MRTLSSAELEQVRLILRGGSVVDWYRLKMESIGDVHAFLRLQGGDPADSEDLLRLAHLRDAAVAYLTSEHGYEIPKELAVADPLELFLYASEKRGRRRDRFFACLILKVMHIIHHIEARELNYRLPLSQSRLAELLTRKVESFVAALHADAFPLVRMEGGEKSTSSLVTKLLVKKEHHAAAIHDRVRFRFVVKSQLDVVDLLARMTRELFPYNYLAPGQTVNRLVSFTSFVESYPQYRALAKDLQLELGQEEQAVKSSNEFSGQTYRVISFVVDVPFRVPDELLPETDERVRLGRVLFALAELQIVDEQTDVENERGENRHDRYRARQLLVVRDRLERGKRGVREDDLEGR